MKTTLPAGKLITLLLVTFFSFSFARAAGNEIIPSGSFIVNMGVVPQTYANGLKPWGMIYDLIRNYKVQVKWIINPTKAKDGTDFTYNGTDFKGGTFIIPKLFRTAAVDSRIAYWQTQGVVGVTTSSDINLNVTYTLKYTPRWTFDFQNGKIAQAYLTAAGIPITNYPMKDPDQLNECDDLFVMPHADPTWATHNNLMAWTENKRGWLWYGCHAGSVIEDSYNPVDPTQQMNFLTTTGLIPYKDHGNPSTPYSYRYPADPEMQFMGIVDGAENNGSESVYLPKLGGGWRPGAKVGIWDPTNKDVPSNSPGDAAIVAYGRAFDNPSYGKVMFQAGHSFDKNNADAVAAIRIFFNFSFMSVADKEIVPTINGSLTPDANGVYSFNVSLPPSYNTANYTYHWTASVPGSFNHEFSTKTTFKPAATAACAPIRLMVTVVDACGREYYQDVYLNNGCGMPPVALDRTASLINNAPGTGAQPVIGQTPLVGTDADGYVVNYILKSLPAGGQLLYDNDGNAATADVAIASVPANGLVLTANQMKSLKFDPADGFNGTASFQYTVTDNSGLIDNTPAAYQIPVNTPPVTQTIVCPPVNSNALLTPACALKATDNGTIVSYTIVSLPPAAQCQVYLFGVLVNEGDVLTPYEATQLKYKPSGTYIGYSQITYTATDDMNANDPKPSTLTLQMVNTPPTANNVAASAIGNPVGTSRFGLKALSATDPDGSIASYTILTLPTPSMGILYYNSSAKNYNNATEGLVLTPAQAASLQFDPNDNYSGVATFKFTATDDGGLKDVSPATYSIPVKVTPPSSSDVTTTAIYTGASNLSGTECNLSALAATPATGKTIVSYSVTALPLASYGKLYYQGANNAYLALPENFELTPSQAATLKFVPVKGVTGTCSFSYTAKDNTGLIDPTPAIFTIPINNAAPVSTAFTTATPLSDIAGIQAIPALQATDADGSIAFYTIVSLPKASVGTLLLNGTPVTEGKRLSVAEAGQLQFNPIPHAPHGDKAPFVFTATDNYDMVDPKGATYTIKITQTPYKKAPKADDKDNPQFNLQQVQRELLPVSGSDSDGVVTQFIVTKVPAANQGVLSLQGVPVVAGQQVGLVAADQFTFMPSAGFKGSATFNYQSLDNDSLASPEATFKLTMSNALPVANDVVPGNVKKGSTTLLPGLAGTDADGSIKTFKVTKLPTKGTMQYDSTGTGVYRTAAINKNYTPLQMSKLKYTAGNTLAADTLVYTATDNMNDVSSPGNYIINIANAADNQVPIVNDIDTTLSWKAGTISIPSLKATDLDGTIASIVIQSIPPSFYGSLYYNDGTGDVLISQAAATITPLQATTMKFASSGIFQGDITFTFNAIDDAGGTSATPATYTIHLTNQSPVTTSFTNPAIPSSAGPSFINSLIATDDGAIQSFLINALPTPAQGMLILDGVPVSLNQAIPASLINRLEFDPQPDFNGNATLKYTAMDNFGAIDATAATVTIPVTNVAPVADDKLSQVITNQLGTGAQALPVLTGSDADGTVNSYLLKSLPTGGKLYKNTTLISSIPANGYSLSTADAGNLNFDPDDNFTGVASFTYVVKDNSGNLSPLATYQIPVNLPPVSNNVQNSAMYPSQAKTSLNSLSATDDGAVSFYTITKLPPAIDGTLYFNDVAVTDLAQVDSILPSQISKLSFQPSASFFGTTFFFTATDNMGIVDVSPATYNIPYTASPFVTLPLNLLQFEGKLSGNDDVLQWSTVNEGKVQQFEVEYSSNGVRFIKAGTVTAKGAASADYNFTNKNVVVPVSYYRLKMIGKDGSFTYSSVVLLKRSKDVAIVSNVSPNPFTDHLGISLIAEAKVYVNVFLSDYSGRLVKKEKVILTPGLNNFQLTDLGNFGKGIYSLTIKGYNINITKPVVKLD